MTEEEAIDASRILRSLKTLLVITAFLLTIVIFIVIVLEIQVQSRNKDIRAVKVVVNETKQNVAQARESSIDAERAINQAIAQSKSASGANQQFVKDIREGLAAIHANRETLLEIEAYLKQLKGQ